MIPEQAQAQLNALRLAIHSLQAAQAQLGKVIGALQYEGDTLLYKHGIDANSKEAFMWWEREEDNNG